ncbi:cAMP-binding domain of CRP or a regulatory subunit of cAMP-dependent protein kinases [Halpernia humi]|uniref:cAMP-binding domain of CRP or a regulatory subunit of cAMP-dependent protein kinases n=1 Tax=Halpernia humi TaxID=493375 RepID=A0A1H5W8T5_9FLAO|nr:Crp/Fnr family transcriptional regulator [Halpernia humi]SEF95778.1 cAMP-binding domain of CRP or a regulatory subunit of cAMP-dependent protein kinases [Halpernia humi]
MEHEKLLDTIKSYDKISKEEETNLENFFTALKIKKGEVLIKSSTPCNKLFFVNSGLLRDFFINETGNEITTIITCEGRFLTNIISFNGFAENNETIECIEDAEILSISKENFDKLMHSSKNLKCIYADIIEEYYALLTERFHYLNTKNVEQKINHLKNDFPFLINRVNDSLIASFLGITRETFVRNKKFL